MRQIFIFVLLFGLAVPSLAQEGNTGVGGESLEQLEDFFGIDSPDTGPLDQTENRKPHEACAACFTIPGMGDGYTIFERVPVGEDAEHIIIRDIPNPAPLVAGETRPAVDDTGEPLWYVGRQAYSGPQDTELVPGLGLSHIALKRIRARNEPAVLAIRGVYGFGMVATGFGVWILPGYDRTVLPKTVEGIPVTVFVEDLFQLNGPRGFRLRSVPTEMGLFAVKRIDSHFLQ